MKLKNLWINLRATPKGKKVAWLLGLGLVLSVIHNPNQPFIEYLYIPVIGNLIVILVSLNYLIDLKIKKEIDLGSRWIWIPLLVITLSTFCRAFYGLIFDDSQDIFQEFASATYTLGLFSLYVVIRKLGIEVFKPFAYAIVIVTASLIYAHIINPGSKTGGIISPSNYDMATGFLVFGAFVSVFSRQWIIVTIALVGLFLTGADEAIFSCFVMALFILFREVIVISKHGIRFVFNKKIATVVGLFVLALIVSLFTGMFERLYINNNECVTSMDKLKAIFNGDIFTATNERLGENGNLNILPLKPFGNGYFVTWNDSFRFQIPHNVPLVIIDQIGILGALAWCVVTGYCLIKTKMKYAWVAVLSLCVFDHYIFTMWGMAWYALVGVSTSGNITNDYIFTKDEYYKQKLYV